MPAKRSRSGAQSASQAKKAKTEGGKQKAPGVVTVNRAPVLALWAAVVAQRLGYEWPEALTLGRAVSGILAASRLTSGFAAQRKGPAKAKAKAREAKPEQQVEKVQVMGIQVKLERQGGHTVAVEKAGGKPIDAKTAQAYLDRAFGPQLHAVRSAMEEAAMAVGSVEELNSRAYHMYEHFRPHTQWGQRGPLSLAQG
eukprot:EG_transcript_24292